MFEIFSTIKESLYSIIPIDADNVSDLFLIVTIGFFVAVVTYFYLRLRASRRELEKLRAKIDGLCPEGFLTSGALDDFRRVSGKAGQFADILMEYNGRMYATQDIEGTCRTLWYPEILHSRIMPACAPILTGIGVLGTFVGLLMGLRGLQLDGDMHNLQNEIRQVSTGASVAFETSVWGVALSLLFTFLEKRFTGRTSTAYLELQNRLCTLFPPFPYSAVLVDQADAAAASRETLSTLAEQLATSFQTTMDATKDAILQGMAEAFENGSARISSSINESMGTSLMPVVEGLSKASQELADRQASVAEDAIRGLVDQFAHGVHDEGAKQREAMERASEGMQEILRAFSASMGSFVDSLKDQRDQLSKQTDEQAEKLTHVFEAMSQSQMERMADVTSSLSTFVATLSTQRELLAKQTDEHAEKLTRAFETMNGSQMERMAGITSSMKAFVDSLAAQRDQLARQTDEQAQKLTGVFEAMNESQKERMEGIASSMKAFVDSLAAQRDQLARQTDEQARKLTGVFEAMNESQKDRMEEIASSMKAFVDSLAAQRDQLARQTDEQAQKLTSVFEVMSGNQMLQMENTASALEKKLTAIFEAMTGNQKLQMENAASALNTTLKNQLDAWKTLSDSLQNDLATVLCGVTDFCDGLKEHRTALEESSAEHARELERLLSDIAGRLETSASAFAEQARRHLEATTSLLEQGNHLQDRVESDRRDFTAIGDDLKTAAKDMHQTAGNMKLAATDLATSSWNQTEATTKTKDMLEKFSDSLAGAASDMRDVVDELTELPATFNSASSLLAQATEEARRQQSHLAAHLEELREGMRTSVDGMVAGVRTAMKDAGKKLVDAMDVVGKEIIRQGEQQNEAMRQHFENMHEQVEALEEQMANAVANMFQEFDVALVDRFNEWNEQTQEFSRCMISTVETINEIVDGLDSKVVAKSRR